MSTHGVVAIGTIAEWRGIYNNGDSQPTSLGKTLRDTLINEIEGGKALKDICDGILAFDDWTNYLNGGVCPYCGKLATQPHSLSGDLVMGNGTTDEFPDPNCLRHEHDSLENLEEVQFTHDDIGDDSDIAWVYVVDVQARVIHVIDNRKLCGGNLYVGDIPLRGEEPNYQHLECSEDFSRCECYAWAHCDGIDPDGPQGRLKMKQYLGMEPVGGRMSDAVALIIAGERYSWNGSAFTEGGLEFTKPRPKLDQRLPDALHAQMEIDGEKRWIPVGVQKGKWQKPAPGVGWVFPATKVMPEFAVMGH